MKKYILTAVLALLAASLIGGCGGQTPAGDAARLDGYWKVDYMNDGFGFAEFRVGRVEYLSFDSGGNSVTLYGNWGDLYDCAPALASFGQDGTLTVSHRVPGAEVVTRAYRYELPDGDTLLLHDVTGRTVKLTRAEKTPAEDGYACQRVGLEYLSQVQHSVLHDTNLLSGNGELWFVTGGPDQAYAIPYDVVSHHYGGYNLSGSYVFAFGMQSGNLLWATSRTGDNSVAKLVDFNGNELASIDTQTLHNAYKSTIETGTYDGYYLWLYGYHLTNLDDSDPVAVLTKVDVTANPPVTKFSDWGVKMRVVAMAAYGSDVWALVSFGNYLLVRLNEDGEVEETFILPYPPTGTPIKMVGLAGLGGDMYVLGEDLYPSPYGYESYSHVLKVTW